LTNDIIMETKEKLKLRINKLFIFLYHYYNSYIFIYNELKTLYIYIVRKITIIVNTIYLLIYSIILIITIFYLYE